MFASLCPHIYARISKKEKEAARLAKESKKIDVLRRRINRLKKRTRKAA